MLPATWPQVADVAAQPLIAATKRLSTALTLAGSPLDANVQQRLEQAYAATDADAIKQLQQVLDPLCLAAVFYQSRKSRKGNASLRAA